MDYSQYPLSKIKYGGSEEKVGIVIEGEHYIVKFQKNINQVLLNNHICEYIGSNIFQLLKEDAQTTTLGTYHGRDVVICKDFIKKGEEFVPFNEIGDSALDEDKENYQYSYHDIIVMLEANMKITNIHETIDKFWNLYIIDALLGNFDRHGLNWGFIKKNNQYHLAPIFDNGSCLFPRINSKEKCLAIMQNEEELKKRTFDFPTSQIRLNNQKSSYYEVIHSLEFAACNEALCRIVEKADLNKIDRFIDTIDTIQDYQKAFYKKIIHYRFEHILLSSYRQYKAKKEK